MAQLAEHPFRNRKVPGSNPGRGSLAGGARMAVQAFCKRPVAGSSPVSGSRAPNRVRSLFPQVRYWPLLHEQT